MSDQREELRKRRDSILAKARALAEKCRDENRELTADETAQIDSALTESREINEKLAADDRHKNIMSQLNAQAASSAGLIGDGQRLAFGKSMAAGIATKMLGDGLGTKTLAPSGAVTMQQEFQPSPIALGQPANSLLSVLRLVTHDTAEFSYLRQTTRTNAAAVVAEGAQKPTSVYSVTRIEDSLDVIAHLSEGVPRFWFLDNVALQQFLTTELVYGLQVSIEAAALSTINAVSGLMVQAYNTSVLATLRKSLTLLESQGYEAGFILVNPGDWEGVELALASTSAVEYQGLPYDASARRLFGVPVVV